MMVISENNSHAVGLKFKEHWEELKKLKGEVEAEPYRMLGYLMEVMCCFPHFVVT